MFNCWWPYGLQHARVLSPALSPRGLCSNPCPLSQWCYLNTASSVAPLSCAINFSQHWVSPNASVLFISWPNSRSVLVLPMNIQGWFSLGLMVWSPCCPRDSQESSLGPQFERTNYLALGSLYDPILTSIHICMSRTTYLTMWTFVAKVISLHFNSLSSFDIFLF